MPGYRSRSSYALPVWIADDDGAPVTNFGSRQETVDLISNGNAATTGTTPQTLYGGDYAWSITGTLGGASVQLQTQDRNGSTYTNYLAARTTTDGAATPPGGTLATFGSAAIVRVVVTGGPPTGLYVSLSRIPG